MAKAIQVPKELTRKYYGVPGWIVGGGILLVGYYLLSSNKPVVTGSTGVVSDIPFSVFPETISPNSTFTINGSVVDAAGNPVSVAKIYYYIYEDNGPLGVNRLITSGVAGENTNSFARTISTVGYNPGTYTVTISDTPVGTAPTTVPTYPYNQQSAADLNNISVGALAVSIS